jgi:hypothetical protein
MEGAGLSAMAYGVPIGEDFNREECRLRLVKRTLMNREQAASGLALGLVFRLVSCLPLIQLNHHPPNKETSHA